MCVQGVHLLEQQQQQQHILGQHAAQHLGEGRPFTWGARNRHGLSLASGPSQPPSVRPGSEKPCIGPASSFPRELGPAHFKEAPSQPLPERTCLSLFLCTRDSCLPLTRGSLSPACTLGGRLLSKDWRGLQSEVGSILGVPPPHCQGLAPQSAYEVRVCSTAVWQTGRASNRSQEKATPPTIQHVPHGLECSSRAAGLDLAGRSPPLPQGAPPKSCSPAVPPNPLPFAARWALASWSIWPVPPSQAPRQDAEPSAVHPSPPPALPIPLFFRACSRLQSCSASGLWCLPSPGRA